MDKFVDFFFSPGLSLIPHPWQQHCLSARNWELQVLHMFPCSPCAHSDSGFLFSSTSSFTSASSSTGVSWFALLPLPSAKVDTLSSTFMNSWKLVGQSFSHWSSAQLGSSCSNLISLTAIMSKLSFVKQCVQFSQHKLTDTLLSSSGDCCYARYTRLCARKGHIIPLSL